MAVLHYQYHIIHGVHGAVLEGTREEEVASGLADLVHYVYYQLHQVVEVLLRVVQYDDVRVPPYLKV